MSEYNKPPDLKMTMLLHFKDDLNHRNPLATEFTYTKQDPYAISMEIYTNNASPVKWVISRELLEEACLFGEETGIGDIKFTSHTRAKEEYLGIHVQRVKKSTSFEANKGTIVSFLADTHKLVPPGNEFDLVNFDENVTKLLD